MARFDWRDGERTIIFGRGRVAELPAVAGDGYLLLTTARAAATATALEVADRAASAHHVPPGPVAGLAATLLETVDLSATTVVALGGGRVIDTAKAIAATLPGQRVVAVPTTLSAAEMTPFGALPRGHEHGATPRRPAIVLNDPDLSASQPISELAASSANSLAHAVEGAATVNASPLPTLAAREAARLIDTAWLVDGEDPGRTGREQLALASVLSGYSIGAAGYGLGHVMSQTLRALAGVGHGQANAVLLVATIGALERRAPGTVDPDGSLRQLATRLAREAGAQRISALGVDAATLERCAEAAARRPELAATPPPASAGELRELYLSAF